MVAIEHMGYHPPSNLCFGTDMIDSIVHDEGYSRNVSCTLNLISTFFYYITFTIKHPIPTRHNNIRGGTGTITSSIDTNVLVLTSIYRHDVIHWNNQRICDLWLNCNV